MNRSRSLLLALSAMFAPKSTTALSMTMSTTLGKKSTSRDVLTTLNRSNELAPYVKEGGTAIVTGGNAGIGAETVSTLALAGMKVVLCARNLEAAQTVKDGIPSYYQDNVGIQELDLANLDSVQQACSDICAKYPAGIDCIINNAGVMAPRKLQTTAQDIELQFGTNHVGHHYMTRLLLPHVNKNGRIVTVASTAHQFASGESIEWEPEKYSPWGAYGRSKLANILFAKRLQELLVQEGHGDVQSVSLHPGVIATNLWQYTLPSFLKLLGSLIADKTVEQGAATNVYCAIANDIQGGAYYSDCQLKQPSKTAEDARLRKDLWDYTEQLLADNGYPLSTKLVESSSKTVEKIVN